MMARWDDARAQLGQIRRGQTADRAADQHAVQLSPARVASVERERISDANVAPRYAKDAEASLTRAGFEVVVITVPAGRRAGVRRSRGWRALPIHERGDA